jgi:hypothetical protein
MTKRLVSVLVAVVSLLPAFLHAQGGPPLLTDDPGTPGNGHWEINVAWLTEHTDDGRRDELPLLDLNYGVGERVQLKYEASWVRLQANGISSESGISNSLVGVKWRFLDDEKTGWQMSTYPQYEFRNPQSSSARRGLSDDRNAFLLPFELQKTIGRAGLNLEIGRIFPSQGEGFWIYGLATGWQATEKFEIVAELHGEGDEELAANLGLRLHCTTHGTLLLSIGRELHNRSEARASLLSYAGWQTTF